VHELRTAIEIQASAERVWAILLAFDRYGEWNPFIRWIRGVPSPGRSLRVRIQPSGARGMTFRPTVRVLEPPRELRWLGRLPLPGLFDGEHRFVIEDLPDGRVRFQHSERFTGLLVPLLRGKLEGETRRGFDEMNAALKRRAEG
jgi:hypothetical protein